MFEMGVIRLKLTGYPFSLSHFMVPEARDDFSVHLQRHRFSKPCQGPRQALTQRDQEHHGIKYSFNCWPQPSKVPVFSAQKEVSTSCTFRGEFLICLCAFMCFSAALVPLLRSPCYSHLIIYSSASLRAFFSSAGHIKSNSPDESTVLSWLNEHLLLMLDLVFRVRLRSKTAVTPFCQQMSPKVGRVFGHSVHTFFFSPPPVREKPLEKAALVIPQKKYPDLYPFKADPPFVFVYLCQIKPLPDLNFAHFNVVSKSTV